MGEERFTMITQSFDCKITNLDIPSKIYNEESVKIFYFCGIRVFKRTYKKIEVMPNNDSKIGFK